MEGTGTRALVLGVAFVYGWWAVSLPPFSWQATVAVVAAGTVAVLAGARRPRPTTLPRAPGSGWWGLLAAAVGTWQLLAYLQHPRRDHPTLSSLANALLDTHGARVAAFVAWIVAAIFVARR